MCIIFFPGPLDADGIMDGQGIVGRHFPAESDDACFVHGESLCANDEVAWQDKSWPFQKEFF